MEQSGTKLTVVKAEVEAEIVKCLDEERKDRGNCSRASLVRTALRDRYKARLRKMKRTSAA